MNWMEKLRRVGGLSASISRTDQQNADVILTIMNAYLAGEVVEFCERTGDDWRRAYDLPTAYDRFRFRIRPE